jgi:hypothetical protein
MVGVVVIQTPVAQLILNSTHPSCEVAKNLNLLVPHVRHKAVHIHNGRIGEWVSAGCSIRRGVRSRGIGIPAEKSWGHLSYAHPAWDDRLKEEGVVEQLEGL